ncbi:hypothetical protein BH09ACT12_BH09ACT12_19360 [soil metagenome]
MLHHKVRRAVAVAAVASVAVTVPLATPAGAESTTAPETPQSTAGHENPAADDVLATTPAPRGQRVRLRVKNQDVRPVVTTRTWARRLLADEQINYDGNDLVRVRRDGDLVTKREKRKLRAGDAVQVVAVDKVKRTRRIALKAPTRTRTVSHLRPGQRKVVAKGRAGVKKIRIVKTRHNRRVVDVDRSSRLVRHAKPRKVLVGAAARSVPGTGHLNWAALARCESSGNPRAVNPAGYYGLYQFNVPTWNSVGGSGVPSNASASEQTYRAKLLYKRRGRSPWPHCGRYL